MYEPGTKEIRNCSSDVGTTCRPVLAGRAEQSDAAFLHWQIIKRHSIYLENSTREKEWWNIV